ncbi:4Fe-4S binding protein [Candidatus Saganbacteria bacterium]|nr:4Fe-4S binding protein [Candidatus Saganbacteria bacterium]
MAEEKPAASLEKSAKYDISVNRAWCKNCRICISFCPTGVYTENELGGPIISFPEKCNNCQLCVIRCPDFAITVKPKEESKRTHNGP